MERYDVSESAEKERTKYKTKCKHCGHILVFTPANRKNKIICNVCGYYVYKNEKEEFKDKLLKKWKEESYVKHN